ncbi:MAG: tRNA uridine-5-carboxymethylaminomethyl(34) synthesis GTPase MnmE [Chitinophagaceae bacterium]|nr:MAG: tRNA uridine-5-carboxymethylaminomethyl(34) synthesis GTPase MnmE [Chitinophagaceae bacterium]
MMEVSLQEEDTIVAPATAPGIAAISVVRLSGREVFAIAQRLFSVKNLSDKPSHTLHYGTIHSKGKVLDEVVLGLFKSPHSYTGEDIVEISCHGSPLVTAQIVAAAIEEGARLAKPGEFTRRAFINGKLDLTQAEAVADLIASQSEAARKTAMSHLRGGVSQKLKELREQLIKFSALIELELDFSQEDVAFADRAQLYAIVDAATIEVGNLADSFQLGNAVKDGVDVAIIGKPNAGKSTLLNALLNEERAIVSDIAGTTRDTIEEILQINGVLFRLVDTAGIREHAEGTIEEKGIERSLQKMKNADMVIYLFDVRENGEEVLAETDRLTRQNIQFIPVGNKMDLLPAGQINENLSMIRDAAFISAKEQTHLQELKQRIYDRVISGDISTEDTLITNTRHVEVLRKILQSLRDIRDGMDRGIPGDLLALDIRHCLHYIGEITGEVSNKEVLDYVFSKFCIGK